MSRFPHTVVQRNCFARLIGHTRREFPDGCQAPPATSRFNAYQAHMLSGSDLEKAIKSIVNQINPNGIFVASIRDYDSLLTDKPTYSPPYIHQTDKGQRVSFQTWMWNGENYKLTQYIVEDEDSLQVSKFECEYRATRREEITKFLLKHGCSKVEWKFPEETGFYQPIVVATKSSENATGS